MARRGERKLQVLLYAASCESFTSEDIAQNLDLEIHNARMLLLKYHRQGLLSRRQDYLCKVYQITEKGLRRIDWLVDRLVE